MHFQRITLVHYHELGLKGHNRATFEKRLMRNLEVLLEDAPVHEITRISGRVLVVYDAAAGADAPAKAAQLIARVPGVGPRKLRLRVRAQYGRYLRGGASGARRSGRFLHVEGRRSQESHRFPHRFYANQPNRGRASMRAFPR